MPVTEKIIIDESQVTQAIKNMVDGFQKADFESKRAFAQMKSSAKDVTGVYADMDKVVSKAVGAVDALSIKYEKLRAEQERSSQSAREYAKNINIAGVNIGDLLDKGDSYLKFLKLSREAIGGNVASLKIMKGVLAGLGIGLAVQAVTFLVGALQKSEKATLVVTGVLKTAEATVAVLADRFIKFGSAVVNTFTKPKAVLQSFVNGILKIPGIIKDNLVNRFKAIGDIINGIKAGNIQDIGNGLTQLATGIEKPLDKVNNLFDDLKDVAGDFYSDVKDKQVELAMSTEEKNEKAIAGFKRQGEAASEAGDVELKKLEQIQKAYQDLIDTINEKIQAARLDQLQGEDRLKAEKKIAEDGLKLLEQNAVTAAELAGKTDQEIHDIHLKFIELRQALDKQYQESVFQINREILADTQENFAKAQESFLPGPELATDFKKALGDALKPEEVFTEFEQALIDSYGPELGRKMVESIRVGADGAGKDGGKNFFAGLKESLLDGLNIDEEDIEPILNSLSIIKESFISNIESQIDANKSLLDSIREQSTTVEEELEKQKELKEQGFANDTTLNEMRLAKLKTEEAKALQEQKKLLKQKQALETAEQIGSLITATANIFKGYSKLPIVGQVLAIAAVASMFAVFIASKARASQAARAYKGGALSDYLGNRSSDFVSPGGPSDVPGRGDGFRVEGTNLRIGGDEFLMSEGPAREHAKFLRSMNKGKFKGVDLTKQLAMMSTRQPNFAKINSEFENCQANIDNANAKRMESVELRAMTDVLYKIYGDTHSLAVQASKQKKIVQLSDDLKAEIRNGGSTIEFVHKMK